jgi:hypothetical protein
MGSGHVERGDVLGGIGVADSDDRVAVDVGVGAHQVRTLGRVIGAWTTDGETTLSRMICDPTSLQVSGQHEPYVAHPRRVDAKALALKESNGRAVALHVRRDLLDALMGSGSHQPSD